MGGFVGLSVQRDGDVDAPGEQRDKRGSFQGTCAKYPKDTQEAKGMGPWEGE